MIARSAASSRARARSTSSASARPVASDIAVRRMAVTGSSPAFPDIGCRPAQKVPANLTSIRLDRQRGIPGPFTHGTVVERELVVAQLRQQEEIDRRRDAAAAIAD